MSKIVYGSDGKPTNKVIRKDPLLGVGYERPWFEMIRKWENHELWVKVREKERSGQRSTQVSSP